MTQLEKPRALPIWERIEAAFTDEAGMWRADSDASWPVYIMYRDMGLRRKLTPVAEETGRTIQNVSAWNVRYRWKERVHAYDRDLGRVSRETMEAQRDLITAEHLEELQEIRALGMQALRMMDPFVLAKSPADLLRYITETQKMERTILGVDEEQGAHGTVVVVLDSAVVPGPTMTPERMVVDADPEPA